MDYLDVSAMLGMTMASVVNDDNKGLVFTTTDGQVFKLWHDQDCCESVTTEDIAGELLDLVGAPLLQAEESTSKDEPAREDDYDDSHTWTFYKFATVKGYVTVRWYGTSNGYYSEGVDFGRFA